MERIPIERRKATPAWLWAILLVALLAVLYFLFFRGNEVADADLSANLPVHSELIQTSKTPL